MKKILSNFKYSLIIILLLFSGCSFFKSDIKESKPKIIPLGVLFSNPERSLLKISPNGKKISYLAPLNGILNIWIKTIGKNDDYAVTNINKRGIQEYVWAENNKYILFVQDQNGDENYHIYKIDVETRNISDLTPFKNVNAQIHTINKKFPYEILITMNKRNKKLLDVYSINLISEKIELIAKNPGNIDVWLADSNFIVRAAVAPKEDGSSVLLLRKDNSGKWFEFLKWGFEDSLVGSVPPKGSRPISFSYDNKFLYLIDSTDYNTQRLIKINLSTKQKEVLAFDDEYDIDSVIIDKNTGEPILVSFNKERIEWIALSPLYKEDLKIILSANNGDLNYIDRSSDETKWILGFINDNGPNAYYLYDRQTKKIKFIFYDKPILNNYTLSKTRPIKFKARDGLIIHGYLTSPINKEKEVKPLILFVHGGPWERDTWGFNNLNSQAQLFANRCYSCLQINFRGSYGYGKKFLNAGDREWGGKMHDDLIDAVNWAVKEKIADSKKIAIYGSSFGGYAALIGATFTPDVFCCAVDFWGPSNLVSLVKSIVEFRPMGKAKWYKRVGNPEIDEQFLKSRSPIFKVDQIKIPVFIAQGANDSRVKQIESDQIVEAMKRKGLDYQYILFPDEGHFVIRPENKFKLAVAAEEFLAKNLK